MKFPLTSRKKAEKTRCAQQNRIDQLKAELRECREKTTRLRQEIAESDKKSARLQAHLEGVRKFASSVRPGLRPELRIRITRGDRDWEIEPAGFDIFPFENGDRLAVVPPELAEWYPVTWGDVNIEIEKGRAIRVPPVMEFFEYRGFHIPSHLISLVGAGPEHFEESGKAHISKCEQAMGPFTPDMHVLDMGCGIGRAAFQYMDVLDERGAYTGIDVTRDSIIWCQQHVTSRFPNYQFHHFDAENELYNPYGTQLTRDYRLPLEDATVDRVALFSVFTHLFEEEIQHYLHEFRRVLKPDGLIFATFYQYSAEALESARVRGTLPWKATFSHAFGNGLYGNDPNFPRGAVAITDEAMRRMLRATGLRLVKPYIEGNWTGKRPGPDSSQDGAVIGIDHSP